MHPDVPLSGQTTEACWNSIAHAKPLGVGLNCALGADAMRSYLQALSKNADCFIHCYPNAGLPNPLAPTGYDEKLEDTASSPFYFCGRRHFEYGRWMLRHNSRTHSCNWQKLLQSEPREIPSIDPALRLSGLEPFEMKGQVTSLTMVGERTST